MGLFDGSIRAFASRICTYLNDRAATLVASGLDHQKSGEQYETMRDFIMAETLREVAKAIDHVARD